MVSFRYAQRGDTPLILEFTKKLAEHEGDITAVKASEEMLEHWLFDKKRAEVLFLLEDDTEIGYCLFVESFVTYLGAGMIFIDDLYVDSDYRGKGYGKLFLRKMAELTKERECKRLEWLCFKTNVTSMEFYQHVGAKVSDNCAVFRVTGDELDLLGK